MTGDRALDEFYAALREDDADLLYERAPCGYLSTTPDGTIVKVNQTFLTWTGYDRADLVGRRRFADLLTAGGRIYHETHYAPMLRMQGTAREIALDVVCADGRRLPTLINSVLECDIAGAPAVVRTALFDATERREYERELLRAKQRAEESEQQAHLLARTLQQTLIPPTPPAIPGLDVAAVYRPAGSGEEVGGDFYDVFRVSEHEWVAVVGDVCGKGVDAAVVTALARYTLRAAAVEHAGPSAALRSLNEMLLREGTERFCTVALVRLSRAEGAWRAVSCSGGHPLPLLVRGDSVSETGEPGSLLGVLADVEFEESSQVLRAGDALVLYTDGVTEGRRDGEFFGDARLREVALANREAAASVAEGILAEVLAFQGGLPRDDIAVVVARVP